MHGAHGTIIYSIVDIYGWIRGELVLGACEGDICHVGTNLVFQFMMEYATTSISVCCCVRCEQCGNAIWNKAKKAIEIWKMNVGSHFQTWVYASDKERHRPRRIIVWGNKATTTTTNKQRIWRRFVDAEVLTEHTHTHTRMAICPCAKKKFKSVGKWTTR